MARGRHRAPTNTGRNLVRLAAVGMTATTPMALAPTANAAEMPNTVRAAIIACESGGKNIPTGIPGPFTASGYYQITNGTWALFGGKQFASRALHASRSEQDIVADRIYTANGLRDWAASKSCWNRRLGSGTLSNPQVMKKVEATPPTVFYANCTAAFNIGVYNIPRNAAGYRRALDRDNDGIACEKTAPKPAPPLKPNVIAKIAPQITPKGTAKKPVVSSHKNVSKRVAESYLIRRGDTLSEIARSHHSSVRRLANLNRATVKNVDLIYAGNHLRLG